MYGLKFDDKHTLCHVGDMRIFVPNIFGRRPVMISSWQDADSYRTRLAKRCDSNDSITVFKFTEAQVESCLIQRLRGDLDCTEFV